MESETKKKVLKKYIFIAFLLIAISISILLMVKYNVEGEKNLPYKLEKIIVKSSIDAQSRQSENLWDLELLQNNDVYVYIAKNNNIASEEKIQSIKFNNIVVKKKTDLGKVKILLPTSNVIKTNYLNSTEDYFSKGFEYQGNTIDNMEKQEICQDGGMLAFRISNQEIGEYIANEGDEIQYNKTLLEKAGIEEKDLQFEIELDMIIQLDKDEKYKGTIKFDLPVDTFENKGIVDKEITDFSKVIFKRCE